MVAGTTAIALVGQLRLPLPFTPVPVTLGTFAVLGAGALLGSRRAAAASLLLAVLAAAGAPVLAGWQSGVGPTFGYVLGYALAALVAGRVRAAGEGAGSALLAGPQGGRTGTTAHGGDPSASPAWGRAWGVARAVGLMVVASALVYVPGVLWLAASAGVGLGQAVALGVLPFLVGDVLKSMVVGVPAGLARAHAR